MIKAMIFDFSRVLLFPIDETYLGSLNQLHRELAQTKNYRLLDHFYLNLELLEQLKSMKTKFGLSLLTSESIQDDPSLQPHLSPIFDTVFSAQKLKLSKKEPLAYTSIANEIRLSPPEILFVDDSADNIAAAQMAGVKTIRYAGNARLLAALAAI